VPRTHHPAAARKEHHLTESTWSAVRLEDLATAEELVLVLDRVDRKPLQFPVWMVVIDDNLYVRSYLGVTTSWYRAVVAEQHQAIVLDGTRVKARFEFVPRTDEVNKAIDSAYLAKYASFDYRDAMVEPAAVDATLRILPD
jgi:hypothetical protein